MKARFRKVNLDILFPVAAITLGFALNFGWSFWAGIVVASPWVIAHAPKLLEAGVALGVETEAQFNGLRSAATHWAALWKRLLIGYLIVALALRGGAIYIVAKIWGIEEAALVATGLTATDPAAIGIALAMVKVKRLEPLFWLLAVESLLNDAIGLVAFQSASGSTLWDIIRTIGLTLIFAFVLSIAESGIRWLTRMKFFKGHQHEALIEVGAVFCVYLMMVLAGIQAGVSLIGMTAIAAIIGDYVVDLIPHEPNKHVEEKRIHYHEWWGRIGLAAVLFAVASVMPLKGIFHQVDPVISGLLILAGIFIARVIWQLMEASYLELRSNKATSALKPGSVSALAGVCLLGVPSIVGLEMFHEGHTEVANAIFAAILLSWVTVPVTVLWIKKMERSMESEHGSNRSTQRSIPSRTE